MKLYQILETDGSVTEAFSGAEEIISDPDIPAEREARELKEYAEKNGVAGQVQTPDAGGTALYAQLSPAMYLVCSNEGEFAPFLMEIPTVIDGQLVYDVEARPKVETPPQETTPPTTVPAQPGAPGPAEQVSSIPQTGVSVVPKYALMILGTVLTLWGLADMVRGREDTP